MNIFDFDDTIYDGDTCKDIIKYGLKKHSFLTLSSLLKAKKLNKKYKKELIPFEEVKQSMLSFIFKVKDTDKFLNDFVNTHIDRIKPWYKEIQSDNDIILTASYELWINKFAEKLGIKHVIGTLTNSEGLIIGKNCKKEEKVRRLYDKFKNIEVENAYSDSSVDIPMLELAKNAFVVEGNELIPYTKNYKFKNTK